MVKKRELEIEQEDVEMQDSSDSSSEEEQRPMQECSDSSSDEEQEQQQQQVDKASDSSSDEEQQQPMEVEGGDSSSDEEQQQQHIEEESDSSSEGEEQHPMEVEETDSSSDEEQQVEEANDSLSEEGEQEQPMEVEQSDSSSEEERTVEVEEREGESDSSSEEEQTMEVDESDQEVESEQEEQESEEEEEVKEEVMEENEDMDESETEEEETEKKSEEQEEVHEQSSSSESEEQQEVSSSESEPEEKGEEQEQASSSESEEEQPKAETKKWKPVKVLMPMEVADPKAVMKKRKPAKVMMPMEAAEPEKKKVKTTHEPEQNEDAGKEGSSLLAALRSLPREKLQDMLVIAAKQHADVLARLKAAAGSGLVHRKVFVGGLSWSTSSKGLKKALSAFGEVEDAVVPKDKFTGSSRGFGFVTFVEAKAAQRAVEENALEIDGSIVECKYTSERESDQDPLSKADGKERRGADQVDKDLEQRKVFVGGLSQTTSSIELKMALSAFGKVEHATVHTDRYTSRSRGFGFVTFFEAEAAQRAAEKNTFEIDGKIVECKSTMIHETDQDPQPNVDEWKRKGAVESEMDLAQRKVFVGGLSYTTSAKGLKKALSAFGKVEGATVHLDKFTGKSRCFGFVTFIDVEAAQHAVEKDTFEIDGKMVECRFDRELDQKPPTKDNPEERKLRVRFDTGLENPQASLRSMLQKFGIVERISVLRDQETGKVKGVAFIMFKKKTAVERALEKPTKMMPNGTIVTCSAWNPDQNSPDEEELIVRWRLNSGLENPETPLYNLFKEFGEVKTIFAHRDHDGKGRSGIVMFVEKTGAENALKDSVQKLDDERFVKCEPPKLPAEERQIAVHFGRGLKNPQEILHKKFLMFGGIEKLDVPRDDVTGRTKGIAFVTFRGRFAVKRALQEPVKRLKKYGKEIRCFPNDISGMEAAWRAVEESNKWPEELNDPATPEEEERTIFVRFQCNPTMTMTNVENNLLKKFNKVGTVEEIIVPCDRVTGTIRGAASIKFAACAEAKKALEAPQMMMAGQIIPCFPNKKLAQEDWNAAE